MTTTAELTEPVAALRDLFAHLRDAGVRCCHWKSNGHLAAAMQGRTDVDLLVDRDRIRDFRRTMAVLDFKALRAAPGKHYSGVENFLGFDRPTGRLIHLHVHYELVLGQQFVKDHRLPIEDDVLDSVRSIGGAPVPSAAIELSILAIRSVLKYRARDAVKDLLGVRSPAIPRHIRTEAEWLVGQTSVDEVRRTLSTLTVALPDDLIVEIIQLLTSPSRPGLRPLVLRTRMRRAIRPFRRMSRPRATTTYVVALARKRVRSLGIGTKRRMTPVSGGTTIAVVGSDGAGKSTVIDHVTRWLSWRLDVSVEYLGNPKRSTVTGLLKRAAKSTRAVHRLAERTFEPEGRVTDMTRGAWRLTVATRRVAEARHRRRCYERAQRRVARASVVLFDRYPLDRVRIDGRTMDGPRLATELPEPRGPIIELLASRERASYGRILPPDHVIALVVSPEVSQRRKPDHDGTVIDAKATAIRRAVESGAPFCAIDADRGLDEVVDEVKSTVWGWL